MDLSIIDPEEKALNERVDKLIGHDVNLATLVKISLMADAVAEEKKDYIISSIKKANAKEAKVYQEEFKYTYDLAGNLIPVNNIEDVTRPVETNSGSIILEPE